MGERTRYTPGTFSWAELTTTNRDAAKAFYGGLFGWEINDIPMGEGAVYSMASLGGKEVAAIAPQPKQQRDAGVPPAWNSYVTVQSADEAVERARRLGATVHAPAFDVMDAGRMAVIQDPQGAYFEVWEPKSHIGASLVNAPGALSWNELASPDLEGSKSFYSELFGWEIRPFEQMPDYLLIMNGETSNGGIRPAQPPGSPTFWLVYFGADDVEASLAKVNELGGSKLMDPIDIGVGKIGIAQDPQGAVFALFGGQLDP